MVYIYRFGYDNSFTIFIHYVCIFIICTICQIILLWLISLRSKAFNLPLYIVSNWLYVESVRSKIKRFI